MTVAEYISHTAPAARNLIDDALFQCNDNLLGLVHIAAVSLSGPIVEDTCGHSWGMTWTEFEGQFSRVN